MAFDTQDGKVIDFDPQKSAIEARGKVLVSASAGTGKTTVMIKRLADILASGVSLDNVLAVTFTKKAAAQMKERLRDELVSRLSDEDEEGRENIRASIGKINSADISTIHSFCARLVRTYFYALDGVDASFEIAAEEAEVNEMQSRALDNLFDRLYGRNGEEADGDFLYLVDRLKKKRNDKNVREAITEAYNRLRIEPNYTGIVQRTEHTFSEEGYKEVCELLGELIGGRCAYYVDLIDEFFPTLSEKGREKYKEHLGDIRHNLDYVAKKRDIFDRPQKITTIRKPSRAAETIDEDMRYQAFFETLKDLFEKLFDDIKKPDDERKAFDESGKLARAFVNVVLQFDREYAAVKRDEGKLDYGDLEHLTYALVCADDGGDNDVKAQIRGKYTYVFVDEYQDVNPIQDAILNAVADNDLFKVGDVKQAIYGFRGSRSHFFAEQLEQAAKEGNGYFLPKNYRSFDGVLNFVNELFTNVMVPSVCGFDYVGGNHVMVSGKSENTGKGEAEIRLFTKEDEEKEEANGVYAIERELPANKPLCAESVAVVDLIDELLESRIYVYDEKKKELVLRDVQAGDICVLTRKKNKQNVIDLERALLAKGRRVDGSAETNVCERADVKRMLNVLSYIDNAEQDVALAAALLSPLGDFSEDELASIRLFGGTGRGAPPFRRCAQRYAEEKGDALALKLKAFYERAEGFRKLSKCLGAARLMDEIANFGGFIAVYADGEKLADLRRLQKEAYSASGELSLPAFLSKLKAADYEVNSPLPPSSDSIKIMTMHASKGLEFPVVIVADISAKFTGDERSDMPYDEQFGFAPRYYNTADYGYDGTVLRKLTKMRAAAEELKNEINLFYVACTRAKSSLYVMCGEYKEFQKAKILTATRYSDLVDVTSMKLGAERCVSADERDKGVHGKDSVKPIGSFAVDEELYGELSRTFGKTLCGEEVNLPVKSSATKLLSLTGEDDIHPVIFREDEPNAAASSIESGVAYHRFLQLCDFAVRDEKGVKEQLENFLSKGLVTAAQYALLDAEQLVKILALPRFAAVAGEQTYREREFLCALPSGEYLAIAGGENVQGGNGEEHSVIVQGAIDLLVVRREGEKVVGADIVDYKYSSRADGELKGKYAAQLALYKTVLSRIYGLDKSAISTTIVNIRSCSEIALDL